MSRLSPVQPEAATGKVAELFTAVQGKLGLVPNMVRTMALSPAVLESYLAFSSAVGHTLNARERELISLAVAEVNGCDYCAAAHSTIGRMVGLAPEAIEAGRRGTASDPRQKAVIELAVEVARNRGQVGDEAISAALTAGLTEAHIVEIVANVALNVFTNFINNVAQTEIDFPRIEALAR